MALLQITEPGQANRDNNLNEVIIGIDLGTTNSLVGVVREGKVEILADENGRNIFPSVVHYGDKVISSIKRLMGKGKDVRIEADGRKIRPEEVSAEILKTLKNIAEKALQKTQGEVIIKKAVITVPAYFDEAAKNATKLAANLADLEVIRLVNEPTAAALAYGLDNASEGIYCVYDLGGGTFDVSILKMQKGVFKVLGVAGDNNLGGDDFDELVAEKLGVSKTEAKKIKEELSKKLDVTPNHSLVTPNSSLVTLSLSKGDLGHGPESCFDKLSMTSSFFNRQDFENLIFEKLNKTFTLTKNLLEDLDLESTQIKGVILVGGSTRIPLVRKKLAEIFTDEKILTNLDPDRIVAIGAAWQAYNLSGARNNLLLDVNALSLGIEMMGGIVEKIIPRNSTIPTSFAKEFTTYADNQTGMKLHIVQGERELAKDCRSLAEFEIKGIPAMKAGMARVLVIFKLDADGLLTVSAEEKMTQQKQEIAVKPTYHLEESEVKKMLLDSIKNSQADIENRLLIEAIVEAKQDIEIVKKDLAEVEIENKTEISKKILQLEKLIEEKADRALILEAREQLEKTAQNLILEKVNSVLNKKIAGKKVEEF